MAELCEFIAGNITSAAGVLSAAAEAGMNQAAAIAAQVQSAAAEGLLGVVATAVRICAMLLEKSHHELNTADAFFTRLLPCVRHIDSTCYHRERSQVVKPALEH